MYDILLFDLDGTLTDPSEGITNSVAYALDKFGIHVDDKKSLYKFIGPPLVDGFSDYYGFSAEDALKATEYYRETFSVKGIYENRVYDGVVGVLEVLKKENKTVILATSKPEKFAREILRYFDLTKYFDIIAGATFDSTRNTKDAVIAYALSKADIIDRSKVVMIGDREHDILGAKENGIDSVGVLYGFGSLEELTAAGATHIAKNIDDILKIVI